MLGFVLVGGRIAVTTFLPVTLSELMTADLFSLGGTAWTVATRVTRADDTIVGGW
jgi:hypothetical protein